MVVMGDCLSTVRYQLSVTNWFNPLVSSEASSVKQLRLIIYYTNYGN